MRTFCVVVLAAGSIGVGLSLPSSRASAAPSVGFDVTLFRPLLADPRENQFRMNFASYDEDWRYGTDITDSTSRGGYEGRSGIAWDVGIGTTLHLDPTDRLLRWKGPWIRYQVGLPAGVFAHFDRAGKELVNADYQFGSALDILWSGAYDDTSGIRRFDRPVVTSRIMVFHRSTHVGDEYLALGAFGENQAGHYDDDDLFHRPPVKRIDLSFEAIRTVLSVEWAPAWLSGGRSTLRGYAGGEFKWAILGRVPSNLGSPIAQLGFEVRSAGNQDDPDDTWITRLVNAPLRRPFFESEWFAAFDWKLAKPYNFAACDNPAGTGETWTPHLWTDCPFGREYERYAGSWHATAGLVLYQASHRRAAEGGRRLAPEVLLAVEFYRGYSPHGQFMDQRLRSHPLLFAVPGITIHF